MNILFNTALKQSASLKRDLSTISSGQYLTPSTVGQISSSLTTFSRTLDSFCEHAKSEINPSKKAKSEERLDSFRAELTSYRAQFKELKLQSEELQSSINKTELIGRRPHNVSSLTNNPYSNATLSASTSHNSPWAPKEGSGSLSMGSGDITRETHALREQSFFANTHTALDEYLARGQAVLGDLSQQRETLKGTQKKLLNVANTIGVSGDTIRMIQKKSNSR